MELQKYTRLSLFLSLAVILSIIESFFPLFNGMVPGLKLGLANTITLFILYTYGIKESLTLVILRVFLVSILRTGFGINFLFSLAGATMSFLFMALFYKKTQLSIVGISVIGSITHTIGQIIIAIIFLNNINIIYYLPILLLFALPTGIIVGLISKELVNFSKKNLKFISI